MKITLNLMNPSFDDKRITDEIKNEFDNRCQIFVFKEESNFVDDNQHAYSIWIEYGINEKEKVLMFEADLDDLELFAYTLTKSIKMLRRDYKNVIADKINNGLLI